MSTWQHLQLTKRQAAGVHQWDVFPVWIIWCGILKWDHLRSEDLGPQLLVAGHIKKTWEKEAFLVFVFPSFPHSHWQGCLFCSWTILSLLLEPTTLGIQCSSLGLPWTPAPDWDCLVIQPLGLNSYQIFELFSRDSHCWIAQTTDY